MLENKRISPQTSVRIARNVHEVVYQEPGVSYTVIFFGKNRKSWRSELMTVTTFTKQMSERKIRKPIATSLDWIRPAITNYGTECYQISSSCSLISCSLKALLHDVMWIVVECCSLLEFDRISRLEARLYSRKGMHTMYVAQFVSTFLMWKHLKDLFITNSLM